LPDIDAVYRFLDKLNDKLKSQVKQIAFAHTKRVLGDKISVVFMIWRPFILRQAMKMICVRLDSVRMVSITAHRYISAYLLDLEDMLSDTISSKEILTKDIP